MTEKELHPRNTCQFCQWFCWVSSAIGVCHYEPPRVYWDEGSKEQVTCLPEVLPGGFCAHYFGDRKDEMHRGMGGCLRFTQELSSPSTPQDDESEIVERILNREIPKNGDLD